VAKFLEKLITLAARVQTGERKYHNKQSGIKVSQGKLLPGVC